MATLLASGFDACYGPDEARQRNRSHVRLHELWRRVSARTGWLGVRSVDLAQSSTAAADKLRTELEAIRSYAAFVRSNPDMPLEHRNHCLDSIVSECADLEKAMNEMIESASRLTRYN